MTRLLWMAGPCVFERGPCGSLRCYSGEAGVVMALVLRYSGRTAA